MSGPAERPRSGAGGRRRLPGAVSLALDVTNAQSVQRVAQTVRDLRAPLDILINNAGVALDGFDADVVRRTLAVNTFGAMDLTDALLPTMAPGARIVMVSSGLGELCCRG